MKTRADEIKEHFIQFHKRYPSVFVLYKKLALDAKNAGFSKYSSRAIFNQIRWHYTIDLRDCEFKLSDHYSPYYSRMLMATDSRFDKFFTIKRLTSSDGKATGKTEEELAGFMFVPAGDEDELIRELVKLAGATESRTQGELL